MEEDIKESIDKFEEYLENVKSNDVHKNSMYNDNYGYVTMQFTPFSNKDIENLIARYKEQKEALQMAKQIMYRDISEDFDYMSLNEFKQYLLKEAEAEFLED